MRGYLPDFGLGFGMGGHGAVHDLEGGLVLEVVWDQGNIWFSSKSAPIWAKAISIVFGIQCILRSWERIQGSSIAFGKGIKAFILRIW
jgi:hypothetical protein